MGMIIAEPIQTLEYLRDSGVFPFSTKEGVLYTVGPIDIAIDTMRKYQKIVNDLKACEQDGMEFISVGFLKEIIDGNDD